MNIEDPEKFELASIVTKNSKTGITSNKRLLVIKKGHLYYYSNVPKKFKGDLSVLDSYHELPKCSIEILNIKMINGYENTSSYFSIEFEAKHMMERDDIRKTMTLEEFNFAPKNTKEMITWQFTCDNQFIKQRWVQALQALHGHYRKEKVKIQKFFNSIHSKEEEKNGPALRSSTKVPWRQDLMKKSSSNESLRKSYQNNLNKRVSAIPSNSRSSQSGSLNDGRKSLSPEKGNIDKKTPCNEDIVEAFMKMQQNKEKLKKNIIVEEMSEGSLTTPKKFNQQLRQPPRLENTEIRQNNDDGKISNFQKSQQKVPEKNVLPSIQSKESKGKIKSKSPEKSSSPQKKPLGSPKSQQSPSPRKNSQQKLTTPINIKISKPLDNNNKSKKTFLQEQQLQQQENHFLSKKTDSQKQLVHNNNNNDNNDHNDLLKDDSDENDFNDDKFLKKEMILDSVEVVGKLNLNLTMNDGEIQPIVSEYQVEMPKTQRIFKKYPIKEILEKKKSIGENINFDLSDPNSFYDLLYFSCHKQYSFSKRIQAQKKLNATIGSFTNKACKNFTDFLKQKNNSPNSNRYRQLRIGQGISLIDIGYISFKIGYISTQALSINGKQKIYYNEESVKQLKREMRMYDRIFNCVVEILKNAASMRAGTGGESGNGKIEGVNGVSVEVGERMKKLRVPLCAFVEYKGVSALAIQEPSGEMEQERIVEKEQLNKWKEVFTLLGLNISNFTLKNTKCPKIGNCVIAYINTLKNILITEQQQSVQNNPTNNQQLNLEHSKSHSSPLPLFTQILHALPKHHNVQFDPPLNIDTIKKAKKDNASVSTASLLRYIKGVNLMAGMEGGENMFTCPHGEIVTLLEYAYLCKYLRKFYRAAQGQIDELHFINLLLKGDKNILQLFQSSGFQFVSSGNKKPLETRVLGIFFELLSYYLGITCDIDHQKFNKYARLDPLHIQPLNQEKKNIIKSVKLQYRVINFSMNRFQLYESFSKFNEYLENKDLQLARKAIEYKEAVYFDNPFQESCYPYVYSAVEIVRNMAELNFCENDYISAINKGKEFLQLCSGDIDAENQEEQQNQNQFFDSDNQSQQNSQKNRNYRWKSPLTPNTIPIYLLMMKCFSKFSEQKFKQMLKEVSETAIYNYGEQSSIMVTILTFAGLTLSGSSSKSHNFEQGFTFFMAAIKNGEKVYRNCEKIRMSELCLDVGRVLMSQGKTAEGEKYLDKVQGFLEEYEKNGKNKSITYLQHQMDFMLYRLELLLQKQSTFTNEENSLKIFNKILNLEKVYKEKDLTHSPSPSASSTNTSIAIQQFGYDLGLKYLRRDIYESCIDRMWGVNALTAKISAAGLAYRTIGRGFESINNEMEKYEEGRYAGLSKERAVLMLEERMNEGSSNRDGKKVSLLEVMEEAFQEEDEEIIAAVFKIAPRNLIRSFQTL